MDLVVFMMLIVLASGVVLAGCVCLRMRVEIAILRARVDALERRLGCPPREY